MGERPRTTSASPVATATRRGCSRAPLLAVAVLLFATADDRHVGKFSDGRQVIRTAVAIAETASLGMASGAARAISRPEGDSVSRYGIGASLAQLPAAFLAPAVEKRFGPASSNALFLLAPFAAVLLAAAAAGGVARRVAGGPSAPVAILLVGLGSHLGAYASSDFSEALQAAALAVTSLFALVAARRAAGDEPGSAPRAALFAGAGAGATLLIRSSLGLPAVLLLLPLLWKGSEHRRLAAAAAAGGLLPAAAWLALEFLRFGHPFGGYGGEGFTHPVLDGLARLLVFPNRGLVVFFPAAFLAAVGLARAARHAGSLSLHVLGTATAALSLLLMSASWWAWHGAGGWGPRLLVPVVPLLAPWAAAVLGTTSPLLRRGFVTMSVLLNVPPLLFSPVLADVYVANCRLARAPATVLRTLPKVALVRAADGGTVVSADNLLATIPSAAPHLQLAWQWRASFAESSAGTARRLASPPWLAQRPDLGPRLAPLPLELAAVFAPPPRWNFLGRSLLGNGSDPVVMPVWAEAMADQVLRGQETSKLDRALKLAEQLSQTSPGPAADALLLESLRLLGRLQTAQSTYASLPPSRRSSPEVLVVLALAARDRGDEEAARQALAAAAPAFPGMPPARVAAEAPSSWPRTYREMTFVPERAAER